MPNTPKRINRDFFRKLLIWYLVICSVPMGVVASFFHRQILQESERRARVYLEQSASLLTASLTDRFEEMYSLAGRLKLTKWVVRLRSNSDILFESVDYNRQQEIRNDVTLYEMLVGVTEQIGVYFPNREMVFTNLGLMPRDYLRYTFPSELPAGEEELLWAALRNAGRFSIYNLRALGLSRARENDLLVACSLDELKKPRAVIYFYLSGSTLTSFLLRQDHPDVLSVSLSLEDQPFVCLSTGLTGEETLVVREECRLGTLPAVCEVSFAASLNTTNLSSFSSLFTAALLAAVIGFVLSLLLARLTYRPVERLSEKMGDGGAGDDFARIERSWMRLSSERDELSRQLEQYDLVLRTQLLTSLLHGLFSLEDRPDIALKLPLSPDAVYQVRVFPHAMSALGVVGFAQARMRLNESGLEAEIVQDEDGDWVLLYTAHENEAVEALFVEELETIESYVGLPHAGVLGVSKSYYDVRRLARVRYFYPTDWEVQLLNQLKLGNSEMVLRILQQLREENQRRDISRPALDALLEALNDALLRVATEVGSGAEALLDSLRSEGEMDPWERLVRSSVKLCESIEPAAEEDDSARLGADVLRYVNENYRNPDLSLSLLQEVFGCSQPVLSRAFKQAARLTYYDYLSRLRIEEAKRLLADPSNTIADVALRAGYANDATFQRAFKRYEGVPPREWAQRLGAK